MAELKKEEIRETSRKEDRTSKISFMLHSILSDEIEPHVYGRRKLCTIRRETPSEMSLLQHCSKLLFENWWRNYLRKINFLSQKIHLHWLCTIKVFGIQA